MLECIGTRFGFVSKLLLLLLAILAIVYAIGALLRIDWLSLLFGWREVGLALVSFFSASIFLTFPSEAIIVAATTVLPIASVWLLSTLGGFAASVINYLIGLKGLRPLISDDKASAQRARAEAWFKRWGNLAVFLGPSVPFAGDAVTVAAGLLKMPIFEFAALSFAGRAVKNVVLVIAGKGLLSAVGVTV